MSGDRYQDYGEPDAQGSWSDDTLVAYGRTSEESTPLLPGREPRKISLAGYKPIFYGLIALPAISLVIVSLFFHFTRCPLYPSAMDAVRQGWQREEARHALFQEEWRLEQHEHSVIEEEWKLQEEWHKRDVAHRIQEENERRERVGREWAHEYERHVREVKEYEEEVARRVHEEQERRERAREEWAREAEEHRHQCDEMARRENRRRENERQKWQREVEDHDRIVEECKKREEEERLKLNMFWGKVEAHTCTTYATREYTAQLMNLPITWEHPVEACRATPLEVHGVSYLPKSCENKGAGIVIGRWEIDQHEPDCATFWNWYKDRGCTSPGSGRRRVEHYMENLPRGGDWREFCATTPAHFNGLEFSGAQECYQYDFGTYGLWEIDDAGCQ